jgi:sigma-54 dependent transcriptional regulator, acetoin dehydrogenase operon transcriptional activator AcoR
MSLSLASAGIQGRTPMLGASRSRLVPAETAPELVVALECDRPLAGASRHSLGQIDTVLLGRGTGRRASRAPQSRELRLELPDAWLSAAHAKLVRRDGQWWIADSLSTNGTLVNGRPCAEACLQDGDLIQAGRTLLWFRQAAPQDGAEDADSLRLDGIAGLATLAPSMAAAVAALPRIARSMLPVVVVGESGTGKELIARAIHALSLRTGPFQAVNCAAIPTTILESELFGARKGAFSGAGEDRPGLVRAAERGTLFLDEAADLAAPAQAALLRFLQESEVLPVGATRPVRVDVRVVAAAQSDLRSLVAAGSFRADLFARLDAFTVRLPPLRERREDLGLLVAALLRKLAPERCGDLRISPEAALALFRHSWPLNVRELEHSLAVALTVCDGTTIEVDHLPDGVRQGGARLPLAASGDRFRDELLALLQRYRGNVAEVARAFGKGRMQVHRWARRYDIDLASFRR